MCVTPCTHNQRCALHRAPATIAGIQAAAKASAAFDDVVVYAQGVEIDTGDTSGIAGAVTAAASADVVVFIGGLITCQESGDQCEC